MRFALITGASSGVGAATAKLFAERGFQVGMTGRNKSAMDELLKDIKATHADFEDKRVGYFVGDVTKEEDIIRVIKESVNFSTSGKIDILVNCAGVLEGGAVGTEKATLANWDMNMNTNAKSVFCFMNQVVPFMEREKSQLSGSIVNVSSVNGLQSFGGVAAYCASKAAVDMLTDCGAIDLAPKNIRVNSVNPGVIGGTELQKRGGLNEEQYAAFLERSINVTHPLGRVATPLEVAEAIFFLADSEKSGFTTGTHITVDGGRRCLGAR